jgi:hypothetical protein
MVKEAAWEISSKLHYPKASDSSKKGHAGKAGSKSLIPVHPRTRVS